MASMDRITFEVVTGAEEEALTIKLYANFVEKMATLLITVIIVFILLISPFTKSVLHHMIQKILQVILVFLITVPLLVTCKLW